MGKLTLPEPSAYGKPVCPVTVRVGLQVLFKSDIKAFSETGLHPSRKGIPRTAYYPLVLAKSKFCL